MTRWLPQCQDFRTRLRRACEAGDPASRHELLVALAHFELDYLQCIQLDRALKDAEQGDAYGGLRLRVALLSNANVQHLVPAVRVAGVRRGLNLDLRAGEYDQYRNEILSPDSWMQEFRPDVIVFSLSARPYLERVPIASSAESARAAVTGVIDEVRQLWRIARDRFDSHIVQQSFLDVFASVFGSHDRMVPASPAALVSELNWTLANAAAQERVALVDVARASAAEGMDTWFEPGRWLQGKMEISPRAALEYGDLLARVVAAQRGLSRKCLVLDLDDTIWGGAVGDVGVEGLVLGPGTALGEAHLDLQRYAKVLSDRGVILAVCSKNDRELATSAFERHPEMLLEMADVPAFVANWDDKAENLKQIARHLNLRLDALVFVDDNPVERARVRESLPMVAVPELPSDPALFARCIAAAGYFESVGFTDDDRARSRQYGANVERERFGRLVQSMDEFLHGLEMSLAYGPIVPVDVARATQLLNKTNQFNTTGRRYTEEHIARIAAESQDLTLQFRLADRFGDNGLVSVMILARSNRFPETLEIENWVMSCRVFGRQLELEATNALVDHARHLGVRSIRGLYKATDRNARVGGLYEALGFSADSSALMGAQGPSAWILDPECYVRRNTFIRLRRASE